MPRRWQNEKASVPRRPFQWEMDTGQDLPSRLVIRSKTAPLGALINLPYKGRTNGERGETIPWHGE